MKRFIFIPYFLCASVAISLLPVCEGAKTYGKKTKDNEVYAKGEVQVEQTDNAPTKTILTLNALYTRRQVKITTIVNAEADLVALNALIVLVEAEADKVVLKIPDE